MEVDSELNLYDHVEFLTSRNTTEGKKNPTNNKPQINQNASQTAPKTTTRKKKKKGKKQVFKVNFQFIYITILILLCCTFVREIKQQIFN